MTRFPLARVGAHLPLFILAACDFSMSAGSHDAAPGDGGADAQAADAPPDGPDTCIGGSLLQVCLQQLPTNPISYNASTEINTSDPGTCAATTNAEAAGLCVIAGTQITIAPNVVVRVVGAKPVVFAATQTITMDGGTIDVGSRGQSVGAGANPAICATGTPATAGNSSGGGYGGSFAGRGGIGESNDGGSGGVSPPATTNITGLRGGCPGGAGGVLSGAASPGGSGGGAIALLARTSMSMSNGTINASGSGGQVGFVDRLGGGGGGSGGMIILDAPVMSTNLLIMYANGGGGAEGNGSGTVGTPGQECNTPVAPALGGSGSTVGGDGGKGSLGGDGALPPDNAGATGGGGGAGGGAGVIRASVALPGSAVSPDPS